MTPEEFYLDQTGETVEQMEAHNDLHEPREMVEFARMYGQKISRGLLEWFVNTGWYYMPLQNKYCKRKINSTKYEVLTFEELFNRAMKERGKG